MSNKPISRILLNRTKIPSAAPQASDLQYGELSLNYNDGKLFYKDSAGNIQAFLKDVLPIDGTAIGTVKDDQGNVITETYVTKASLSENLIDYVALYDSIMDDRIGDVIVSAGGRKLYRHISNMGTVIEFNDGRDRKVLVLDAQYRSTTQMATRARDIPNLEYSVVGDFSLECSLTDSQLNDLFVDTNTSKLNTDAWVGAEGPAALNCRSILVNGVGCDIPNINTLMRIWCEKDNLDMLDPTTKDYQSYRLIENEEKYAWLSSNEASRNDVWVLVWFSYNQPSTAFFEGGGTYGYKPGSSYQMLCPVLELE